MIKTINSLFFLSLILLLGACSEDSSNTIVVENKSENIVILHMNDIHADINNFPKVAAYVKNLRETNENVFLLSAGDLFSGNPMVDQHEKPGYPMIDLMNQLKFDAAVIGNHEFDYGQDILNKRMNQANFPFICANMNAENAVLNQPEPYTTLKTNDGFSIIVLGLVETGTNIDGRYIPSTHPEKVKGIDFPYYKHEIKDYTNLKKTNNLFLILSHLGEGSDQKLADENSEIDIIVGGHSHKIIQNPYVRNNALICQAGSKGRFLGRIDIQVEDGLLISKTAKLIEVKNLNESDEEISSIVSEYNNNPILERVIANNLTDFTNKDELGSLMTDAVNWKLNTDIAFQNSGGIRSSLPLGEIKVKDIYELDPFNNEIIIFEMTCDEIRSLINNSGKGDLKVAGIQYRYNDQDEVQLENYDGSLLDESIKYKVGMNSYIASAYTFDHTDEGQNTFITSSNCLIKFLENEKEINYNGIKRIFGAN